MKQKNAKLTGSAGKVFSILTTEKALIEIDNDKVNDSSLIIVDYKNSLPVTSKWKIDVAFSVDSQSQNVVAAAILLVQNTYHSHLLALL